jgi:hypothetical protein
MEKPIDVSENALKVTTAGPVRNTGLGFRTMAFEKVNKEDKPVTEKQLQDKILCLQYSQNETEKECTNLRHQISEMTVFLLRMENFINRFFDPEDLGYTVTPSVRDDAREALGRERVES